jgi:hypothetical protein
LALAKNASETMAQMTTARVVRVQMIGLSFIVDLISLSLCGTPSLFVN